MKKIKIKKSTLFCLPSEGRITLQVPQYTIDFDPAKLQPLFARPKPDGILGKIFERLVGPEDPPLVSMPLPAPDPRDEETMEIPADWLMDVSDSHISVGRESGFTHISPKGWVNLKDQIKEAFESSPQPRGTWEEFAQHAEDFFDEVLKGTLKRASKLEKKATECRDAAKAYFE